MISANRNNYSHKSNKHLSVIFKKFADFDDLRTLTCKSGHYHAYCLY